MEEQGIELRVRALGAYARHMPAAENPNQGVVRAVELPTTDRVRKVRMRRAQMPARYAHATACLEFHFHHLEARPGHAAEY